MKNFSVRGQESVEVILITVLVFFAAFFSILFFSDKIANFFKSSSANKPVSQNSGVAQANNFDAFEDKYSVTDELMQPGQRLCSRGMCDIQFDGFKLSNIPEDFNAFVLAQGSSGGTDKIAELMKQIATQLASDGNIEQSEAIKKLASFTHNMASIEKEIENLIVGKCNYSDNNNCISEVYYKSLPKPTDFDETYMSFPEDGAHYKHFADGLEISYLQSKGEERLSYHPVTDNYFTQLETVMNDPAISDAIKGVLRELTWDINEIGEGFSEAADPSVDGNDDWTVFQKLNGYDASTITHFDSALVCASGNNSDTGTKCH